MGNRQCVLALLSVKAVILHGNLSNAENVQTGKIAGEVELGVAAMANGSVVVI